MEVVGDDNEQKKQGNHMKIDEYITLLRNKNILITVQEDNLAIEAPDGALTSELIEDLKAKKQAILDFFNSIKEKKQAASSIPISPELEYYPLSSAQKRMYFLYEFDKESTSYNISSFYRIGGEFSISMLESAFKKLVARHESLHTLFALIDGYPVQRIVDGSTFEINYHKGEASEMASYINSFVRPFDLSQEIPVRVSLMDVADEDYLLIIDMHHIINDGVSQAILMQEFWSLYNESELPELGIQYKDYAYWQQSDAHQALVSNHKSYWLKTYSKEIVTLELPMDHPRPVQISDQGGTHMVHFDTLQTNKLRALATAEGVTMYTLFLAIYNVLLSKLSNQFDIIVGTPTAGRHHADLEGLVGMFVNTLALRNQVDSNLSFKDFLASVQDNTLSAFDHQLYQYEELVDELELSRDTSRNPLFDVFFSYDQETKEVDFSDSEIKMIPHDVSYDKAKFDLSLVVLDAEKISVSFSYRTDLFETSTITRFSGYLDRIVNEILKDATQLLGAINILSQKERTQLLVDFNDTFVNYDLEQTVLDMFMGQCVKTPDAEAIVFGEERLTYQELDIRSDLWALSLIDSGVAPGSIVGLITTRSSEMITAILAIMKSGAAYLPINPEQPVSRTHHMLEECDSTFLISNVKELTNDFEKDYSCLTPDVLDLESTKSKKKKLPGVSPDSLAYVIYTSGSTGQPKGVKIKHKGVANLNNYQRAFFQIDTSSRILQFSPYYFDASVEQIWLALAEGATLVLINKESILDRVIFINYLSKHKITYLHSTPSFLENLPIEELPAIRIIISGGEKCKPSLVNQFIGRCRFINEYGPTEGTVVSMAYEVPEAMAINKNVPIGKPIANTQAFILSSDKRIVPIGVIGALYIGGIHLAEGYMNKPELTQERFIENPFGEGRLYRTGDLARWLPDGIIEFMGRNDHQVKLRGYRIELGEIESQLEHIESVNQALVLALGSEENKQLIAYLNGDEALETTKIKSILSTVLPDYMIPTGYIWLDNFPMTPNGKIDQKALPSPDLTAGEQYLAPENEQQEQLVLIWSEVLDIKEDKISISSDFFSLGGHSLIAIKLVNKINQVFSVNLPLRDVFKFRTIAELSVHLIRS